MRSALKGLVILVVGLVGFGFALPQADAAGAPGASISMNKLLGSDATSSLIRRVSVQCRNRNFVCRKRWGIGTDYRRCMRLTGCLWWTVRGCSAAERLCRDRWGIGPDYRRCMTVRGCL